MLACAQPPASVAPPAPKPEPTASVPEPTVTTPGDPGNSILVILLDDIGVDQIASYGMHPDPAYTPTIDSLAASGVQFDNAYAQAACSPSRAALLTGRYPRRSGVGEVIHFWRAEYSLPTSEILIPEALAQGAPRYTSVAAGKWHLAAHNRPAFLRDPLDQGFSTYAGSVENLAMRLVYGTPDGDYTDWDRNEDGVATTVTTYATTRTVDDALDRIQAAPEPWFAYVALNAPHSPFHTPPAELITATPSFDQSSLYRAMLEAADTEIGRLLAGIPPDVLARTTIVLAGDNGTPGEAILPPWDPERAKLSLYEAGVRVPLIVSGPLVAQPGSRATPLVHLVDVLPTVTEIAGFDAGVLVRGDGAPVVLDGRSLVPWLTDPAAPDDRLVLYNEKFAPNGPPPYGETDLRSVRNARWKLMIDALGGQESLYRLTPGVVDEGEDLLASGTPLDEEARTALDGLRRAIDGHEAMLTYEGDPAAP